MDLVAEEEHLGDVHLVDVAGVGDDDGGLGAAAPPRVGVDQVILDGDVISLHQTCKRWLMMFNGV